MKKYFIESSKYARSPDGSCYNSDITPASEEAIAEFKSKLCDHTNQDLLVYDEERYMYDLRRCGVCDQELGFI